MLLVDGALAPSSLEMELITILTQAGYAVLPVDTRSAMQHPAFNQQRPRNRPAFVDQQQIQATVNAHRALQFLEHQPQIDAQRVAVMGLGNTSPAIRMLMDTRVQQKLAHQPDAAFAVHVELYNHCDVYFDTDTTTGAPLISFRQMFMSVKDRQACAEQDLILNTAGSPIEVYGNTVGAPSRYKKLADQAASSSPTPEAFCVQAHCRPLEKRGSLLAPPIFTRQLLQALGGHLQEQR